MNKVLKISRSGLRLFLECPRRFWLDVHHKIKRPAGYPYTLSSAVDYLVKQEFDKYRVKDKLPPIFQKTGIPAKLYSGPELSAQKRLLYTTTIRSRWISITIFFKKMGTQFNPMPILFSMWLRKTAVVFRMPCLFVKN